MSVPRPILKLARMTVLYDDAEMARRARRGVRQTGAVTTWRQNRPTKNTAAGRHGYPSSAPSLTLKVRAAPSGLLCYSP
jgi:hypothetical protein